MKIFCFPYAGGSSAVFNCWRKHLDKRILLRLLELSGRGRRIYDPLYDSVEEAVDDLLGRMQAELGETPYALLGHSLGAILVYELARKIETLKLPPPCHIFFAGRGVPHAADGEPTIHMLPDSLFQEQIMANGATPNAFFEHPQLVKTLLPMLRSDFKIAELYTPPKKPKPFHTDITVMVGKDEKIPAELVHGWKDYSTGECRIHYVNGNHFFITENPEKVVEIINQTLLPLM